MMEGEGTRTSLLGQVSTCADSCGAMLSTRASSLASTALLGQYPSVAKAQYTSGSWSASSSCARAAACRSYCPLRHGTQALPMQSCYIQRGHCAEYISRNRSRFQATCLLAEWQCLASKQVSHRHQTDWLLSRTQGCVLARGSLTLTRCARALMKAAGALTLRRAMPSRTKVSSDGPKELTRFAAIATRCSSTPDFSSAA